MKTYFITGGAGFIGYFTTERLIREGYNVVCIDNINDYYDVNLKYDRLFTDELSPDEVLLGYRETKGNRVSFEQVLDIQPGLEYVPSKDLLAVYVINPDYYFIFADLITDVLEFIVHWKNVSGNFVIDYEAGHMGGL